jgi:hypothetical protein
MECKDVETKRDDYEHAVAADVAAIKSGAYNFKGVGEPASEEEALSICDEEQALRAVLSITMDTLAGNSPFKGDGDG